MWFVEFVLLIFKFTQPVMVLMLMLRMFDSCLSDVWIQAAVVDVTNTNIDSSSSVG